MTVFFAILNPRFRPTVSKIPLFTRGLGFQPPNQNQSDNPNQKRNVINKLSSIFAQNRFDPNNSDELTQLAPQLTPEIVESVLIHLNNWKTAHDFFLWSKSQKGFNHNCYTYNTMASILSGVRRNAPMKSLFLDFIDSNCTMSPGALGYFIRCLGSVGLVEEANIVFDRVKETGLCLPNSYTYNCLLEVIAKSGLVELAERRLDEMRKFNWTVNKYTLTPILSGYCNASKFDKALGVFEEMCKKGWVDAHVLSILALSFSKQGDVDKAFELIERMEGFNLRLNEKTFFVLVHGFVSKNKVDKAVKLFDKMCEAGFSPDIAVFDVLIGGLCTNKDPEGALRLYSLMKSYDVTPDIGILNKLMTCVTEEEKIVDLLEDFVDGRDDKVVRSLYDSVLNNLVRNDSVDRAVELVKMTMEETSEDVSRLGIFFKRRGIVNLDSSPFCIIINALCEKGMPAEALELFKAMDKFGCQKNTTLYNYLIDALCYADRVMDGLDLLEEMKKFEIPTTDFTYNSVYGYFCRKGDVVGAMNIVKEMCVSRHEPWIKNSTTLVKKLCEEGRTVEASNFLAEMVQEGLVPHLIPYSAAIDEFFKLKEVDHALELFHNLCFLGYKPDVVMYNIVINGLSKANRMAEAENMLKEMLDGGVLPSTVTYNSLMDGWCRNGDIDRALACFSKMVEEGTKPSVVTYTTLIDGLCNAGRPDHALMLWNKMDGKSCSPNKFTLMAFVSGLCKNNMPDMALFYIREMQRKGLKVDTFVYISLMESFLSNKNPLLALDMMKEMVEKDMFPSPEEKNHTLLKSLIAKLADDRLTSRKVKKLIAEGGIPIFSTDLKNEEMMNSVV